MVFGVNPTVSIVIPVHNAGPYLGDCLDSILGQDFGDYEVICVNDRSEDDSVEIIKKYCRIDSRFSVAHCEGNAALARNAGLALSSGEYVCFLDADDFFESTMLMSIVSAAKNNRTDVVLFAGRRFDDRTKTASEPEFLYPERLPDQTVFSANDCPDCLFQVTTPAPWSKLFRRQFLIDNELEFQSLPNSNDLYLTLSALSMAERICAVDEALVNYRVNVKGSIQATKEKDPLCFFSALLALKKQLEQANRYELLELTFCWQAESTIKYNIKSASSSKARIAIIDELCNGMFTLLGLDDLSSRNILPQPIADLNEFILSAMKQRNTLSKMEQYLSPTLTLVKDDRQVENPAVSVVIPVYNVANYLEETLVSIQRQVLTNIEIICIDDGSSDGSLELLVKLAQSDRRIVIYTQDNSGLSVARNAGIKLARGRYIYFIDSDDLLRSDALETLTQKADRDALQLVLFDADSFFETEDLAISRSSYRKYYCRSAEYSDIYTGQDLVALLNDNGDYLPSACLYLAKREFVDSLKLNFIPGIIHEDNAYTFTLLLYASRVSHIKEEFYRRRVRSSSIMTSNTTFANVFGYWTCACNMYAALNGYRERYGLQQASATSRLVYNAVENARKQWIKMPNSEIGGMYALPDQSVFWIDLLIGNPSMKIKGLRSENKKLKAENKKLKKKNQTNVQKLKRINNSRSYKLSRRLSRMLAIFRR